ncbi:MAG: hypothetical protein ACXVH2_09190 [Methanobacterium sp.]
MTVSIKALVFDAYGTLFDIYSVKEKCDALFHGKGEEIFYGVKGNWNFFFASINMAI